jgi:hypothetical protein
VNAPVTTLVQAMRYIQFLHITRLVIILHLDPTCVGSVGSPSGTESELIISKYCA